MLVIAPIAKDYYYFDYYLIVLGFLFSTVLVGEGDITVIWLFSEGVVYIGLYFKSKLYYFY